MFQRKRRLKKEDKKHYAKQVLFALALVIILPVIFALIYHSFSFGSNLIINPLSKTHNSFEAKVKETLEKDNIEFAKAETINGGAVVVNLQSGAEITFTQNKDLNAQIASLQLLLSRLTIEDKKLKALDFRFGNPVVSFN